MATTSTTTLPTRCCSGSIRRPKPLRPAEPPPQLPRFADHPAAFEVVRYEVGHDRLRVLDKPLPGNIAARREGEPSFTHVQDIADSMMAAMSRGVDLVIPERLARDLGDALPPVLPEWVKIN
jgi:hypothetical protein